MRKDAGSIKRNKRRGFFLVFSLGVLIVISLFCLGLGFRTYIQTRKTKFYLNKQRAFYLAVSGVKIAMEVLAEDKDQALDYLGEDWAKPIEKEFSFVYPEKTAKLLVQIEDETSRININTMGYDVLRKLLEQGGVDEPDIKAQSIIDYIDADSGTKAGGMEDEGKYKNAPLSVLPELLLVEDFSSEDYGKIKDSLSVFGKGKVNINTVTEEMLDFFIYDSYSGKNGIVTKLFAQDNGEPGYYSVAEWEAVANERINEELGFLLKDVFCVNSNYYRISSEAEIEEVKKKITCIVNRNSGKILYWYEN